MVDPVHADIDRRIHASRFRLLPTRCDYSGGFAVYKETARAMKLRTTCDVSPRR
jgi:hypothetical protein